MSGTGTPAPIIIKKVKKGGHGGAHGGSWKVAYADFVTAMMAFFLLLWLINMVSDEKKARVSQYFKEFSLFEKGGHSFMMDGKASEKQFEIIDSGESGAKPEETDKSNGSQTGNADGIGNSAEDMATSINERLKMEIESKLSDMKEQILVDIDDGASRIEIIDKKGGMLMFSIGSKEMSPEGKKALSVIAVSIKEIKGKIAIEGHTDSSKYAGTQYSNWELSTERASAARKELESSGISPDKFIRVAGYADTDPLIKEDTLDPRNRRISIRVFPEKQPDSPLPVDGSYPSQNPVKKGKRNKDRINKNPNNDDLEPIGRYLQNR